MHSLGYARFFTPERVIERDTFTCPHCQFVVHITPKTRPEDMGGWCRLCMKPICKSCNGKPCRPFEKQLEAWEASYHARRSYGF